MTSRTNILKSIIDFMNEYNKNNRLPKINLNELSVDKDSMCISLPESSGNNVNTENIADVTGRFIRGNFTLDLTYRVMLENKSLRDLDFTDILNNIYYNLKSHYKELGDDDWYIYEIKLLNNGNLTTVYKGGVKDYILNFSIIYERGI